MPENTTGLKVEFITQHQVDRLVLKLARKILRDRFRPDIIVAIARGGYVPARLLCDLLDIYNLASMRIAHYTGAHKNAQAHLSIPLNIDVRGMRVLLVDDIDDTGDTLALAREHILSMHPAELRTAVLHHKTSSTSLPDYYAHKIIRWRWITYPWAVVEDVLGFVRRMQPPPTSMDEASARLAKDYNFRADKQIMQDVFRLL